jgi:hypothetical protein
MDSEVASRSSIERWRSIPWRAVATACIGAIGVAALVVLTDPPNVLAALLIGCSAGFPAAIVVVPLAERLVIHRIDRPLRDPDVDREADVLDNAWARLYPRRTRKALLRARTGRRLRYQTHEDAGSELELELAHGALRSFEEAQDDHRFVVDVLIRFVALSDAMTREEVTDTQAIAVWLRHEIAGDPREPAGFARAERLQALVAFDLKLRQIQARMRLELEPDPSEGADPKGGQIR